MFDPKAFHQWLKKRYPQYNPLSVNDRDFIEAVSLGNLEHIALYDHDSNKKFFMGQIVEHVQENRLRSTVYGFALGAGMAMFIFGITLLLMVSHG